MSRTSSVRGRAQQMSAWRRLLACGPLTGDAPAGANGALFIYETDSVAAAREILAADPYEIGGVFTLCQLSQWEVIKANPALLRATP
jgi:uncharacterized protein YciI